MNTIYFLLAAIVALMLITVISVIYTRKKHYNEYVERKEFDHRTFNHMRGSK